MSTDRVLTTWNLVATGIVILLFLVSAYVLGVFVYSFIAVLAGHKLTFGLPVEVRLLGLLLMAIGLAVSADVFRFRRASDVWASTSVTVRKMAGRRPMEERTGRTEEFIPLGPYVYVRSPMYFGVVAIVFGLGMAESSGPLLLWALILACFYWFILIPFEERELQALFGESFVNYRRQVPKLFPYGRRYRSPTSGKE